MDAGDRLAETDAEEQSLTGEDQLFILMQAGQYLTATRGFAAPEAQICYERIASLCHSLNLSRPLYVALVGQWRYSLMTDKLTATMQIAERVYSLAQEQNDAALMIRSLSRFGSHALLFGRFRVLATIRDAWCSDLALWRRTVSGRRTHHPRRHLSVPSGTIRVASRRNRLLPSDNGRSDFISERAE